MRKSLLAFLFLLFWISVSGISPRFKHITSQDGLSQSEIYAFCEDSRGYMWIGTVDGLNRYDGYEIKVFNIDSNSPYSLPNNTVRSLAEDRYGRVWIGTDNGLCYYDPESELIYRINHSNESSSPNFAVHALFCEKDFVYLGTNTGLFQLKISDKDLTKTKLTAKNKLPFISVKELQNIPENTKILNIISNNDGSLWLSSYNSIFRIKISQSEHKSQVIETIETNDLIGFREILKDKHNNIWSVSSKGVLRYNTITKKLDILKTTDNFDDQNKPTLNSIVIDKENNIWVGSIENGLYFLDNQNNNRNSNIQFLHIKHDPINNSSLNSDLIYSLYVSKNNLLWVGTIGSGVNIYNPEQKDFNYYKLQT